MKATTPKPRKKSTVTAKKAAKTGSIVSATTVVKKSAQTGRFTSKKMTHAGSVMGSTFAGKKTKHLGSTLGSAIAGKNIGNIIGSTTAKTLSMQNEPVWVRREVKGLMEALSGR